MKEQPAPPLGFTLGAFPSEEVHAPVAALLSKTDDLPIPTKADFSSQILWCRNQDLRGTCIGHACWGAMMAFQQVLYGWSPTRYTDLSPGGIYNRAKTLDQNPTTEGTWVFYAAEALRRWGACREVDWPYDQSATGTGAYVPPNLRQTTDYKIADYAQSAGIYGVRRMVSAFGPGPLVISVPWSFFVPKNGVVDHDPNNTYIYGYHCVLPYKYDDDKRLVRCLNSYGRNYGINGSVDLTYDFIEHNGYDNWGFVSDFGGKISGDLDGSSTINVLDVHLALQAIVGSGMMTEQMKRMADMTGDAKIDVRDAVLILRKAMGD